MKRWLSLPENGATERFIIRRGWKVGDMAAYLEVECSPEVLMYHRALNTSVFDEVKRNVGHCVLTVSGLPGFEDSGRAGAALLTSTVLDASLSSLKRTRATGWLLPSGSTEGSQNGVAPKKKRARSKFGRVERRNLKK